LRKQKRTVDINLIKNEKGRIFLGSKLSHNLPTIGNITDDANTENIIILM
jgi:hypothetical protein